MVSSGGFIMVPLFVCSLAVWVVILERLIVYRRLEKASRAFHLELLNRLLQGDLDGVQRATREQADLPQARVVAQGLERLRSKDQRLRNRWREAMDRGRAEANQSLRQRLWILGTIGSAAPFIGLFGTVVGILRSFQDIAKTGAGGFAVVAAGISEALIATAAGIIVAVVAVMTFNAFQTWVGRMVLELKARLEETVEVLETFQDTSQNPSGKG